LPKKRFTAAKQENGEDDSDALNGGKPSLPTAQTEILNDSVHANSK
jgi:hypothetical protein